MTDFMIEYCVKIVYSVIIMLIGLAGTWLTVKLGKKTDLSNINTAMQEVIKLAEQTVDELQQTTVEGLKAANKDGKLTTDEIRELGQSLIDKTMVKMSSSTKEVLNAASVDITALIKSAGEARIAELKNW